MASDNQLIHETSAYLQQHAQNPVDWNPWGEEAFKKAKKLDRPVFLSIGYSACHWCHVMEEESFTDAETARVLNDNFVSIKVDREERPDVDQIYMAAVQLLNQRGGWPLSVFLTPDKKPFYGGTYFPLEDRQGMPSFKRILSGILAAWKTRRSEITQTAEQLNTGLKSYFSLTHEPQPLPPFEQILSHFISSAKRGIDPDFGGFGQAPKFFHTEQLQLFLLHSLETQDADSREFVLKTLDLIARGGVCDQIGGGFHRYSTDRVWLVPHFEKMLYDNALLTQIFLRAFSQTGKPSLARVAHDTLTYVLREMTDPAGGFYSTLDADSEGEEGRFYVWTREDFIRVLPADEAELVASYLGISDSGNWEGTNIPHRPETSEQFCERFHIEANWLEDRVSVARRLLLHEREKRVRPFRDEKIIVAWNGMMIETLAEASTTLQDREYLSRAEKAAQFILNTLKQRRALAHSIAPGPDGARSKPLFPGFLDDYAHFAQGLLGLFTASQNPRWLTEASEMGQLLIQQFWDDSTATFFYSPADDAQYVARPRDFQDGAIPAASATATLTLAKLGLVTGTPKFVDTARMALNAMSATIERHPQACGQWILAANSLVNSPQVAALCLIENGEEENLLKEVRKQAPPHWMIVKVTPELARAFPIFADKKPLKGEDTLHLCSLTDCAAPISGAESILSSLR